MAFENVAGYESIKKELSNIVNWLSNREELLSKGIDVPKGVLFFGEPGNGKSLLAREFISLFPEAKVFILDGKDAENEENNNISIMRTFEEARATDKLSIIIIDEIDSLLGSYRTAERELLSEMDGININNNIFVIATCNDRFALSEALTRRGRLDYLIGISSPNKTERKAIFNFYINKYGINTKFDVDYLSEISPRLSVVEIKAICNEAILRYGENVTLEEFEKCINIINERDNKMYGDNDYEVGISTAYHEAGHAIMAYLQPKYFKFYKAEITTDCSNDGICRAIPTGNDAGSFERVIADIKISLAGQITSDMLLGFRGIGAESDIDRARHLAAKLVSTSGYAGFDRVLNHYRNGIPTSDVKLSGNEKRAGKILKSCEKDVRKTIKKYKKEIGVLANKLYEDKIISYNDVASIMGD